MPTTSFLDSTREALTIFELPVGWISSCHTYRGVGLNNFNIIPLPLNKALVHYRRDATISVDPVMTKEQTICSFNIDDEEGGQQSLTPNRQFDVNCPVS